MADSAQRHPNLNLTPEEKRVFYQLFQAADTTNLGVITGEIAVPFFEKTKLAPETLGLTMCRYGRSRIRRTGGY
jgi:epidermal growth factor receptor substrate 15